MSAVPYLSVQISQEQENSPSSFFRQAHRCLRSRSPKRASEQASKRRAQSAVIASYRGLRFSESPFPVRRAGRPLFLTVVLLDDPSTPVSFSDALGSPCPQFQPGSLLAFFFSNSVSTVPIAPVLASSTQLRSSQTARPFSK